MYYHSSSSFTSVQSNGKRHTKTVNTYIKEDNGILVIGETDDNGDDSGHVRVYEWDGTSWGQLGQDISGEAADDKSGRSVSLSSDGYTLAIGAPQNDGNGANSGHVRVYEWNGTSWVQKGGNITGDIDGEAAGDQSGFSVALSADGSIVAIGAINNDGNDGTVSNSGHVRVYEWNGTSWVQKGGDIDGEVAGDQSGFSVALSADGSIVAIGAPLNDDKGGNSGHTRVYEWSGTTWVQKGIDIIGELSGDRSGFSVDLNSTGSIVAIGAIFNDGGGGGSGHVRVYEWNGSAWEQKGGDIDGEGINFYKGWSVALNSSGSIVATGEAEAVIDGQSQIGTAKVFSLNGTTPTQEVEETVNFTNTVVDINIGGNPIIPKGRIVAGNPSQGITDLGSIVNWFETNTPTFFDDTTGITATTTKGEVLYYATNIDPTSSFDITINGTTVTYDMETQFPSTYSFIDNNNNLIEIRPIFKGSGGLEVENLGSNTGIPCLTNTCYILTPSGYKNVSTLKVGDIVTTHDNRHIAIEKLFSSKVLASRVKPRLIRVHQYGENKPFRDTYLSDLHAYNIGGKWKIPKNECLPQKWDEREVTYYHIKLPNYRRDFLVVNGLITECWGGLIPKN
jgi:hypothetical protein